LKLRGAEIVIEVLRENGVELVFGYPGASVLSIYDALYSEKKSGGIFHILTSSESGAAHAADGYARASGKTGVCIATSGPGATNLVTGIASAFMDSSPVVFITGNVPTSQIGTDSFQEVDATGITLPVTKYNVMVKDISDLARELRLAFRLASSGRKGPVLVDIPRDILEGFGEYTPETPKETGLFAPPAELINRAADLINSSQTPVILAGGGTVDASVELLSFAEKLGTPIVTTVMGLGNFPASHPQFLGFAGVHGSLAANAALRTSDLVIAVGARFSDRVVRPASDPFRVLHIDIDRSEIDKNIKTELHISCDAAAALAAILPHISKRNAAIRAEKSQKSEPCGGFTPTSIFVAVDKFFGGTTVATDVGQHQIWALQNLKFERPRSLISSGGLGAMGFGLGAAIGASLATGGGRVLLVTGDGSFLMNSAELATVVRQRLPITVLLLKNGTLGLVRQQQKRYSETSISGLPDFCTLAESYGVPAARAYDLTSLETALKTAHASNAPKFIECAIGKNMSVAETKI